MALVETKISELKHCDYCNRGVEPGTVSFQGTEKGPLDGCFSTTICAGCEPYAEETKVKGEDLEFQVCKPVPSTEKDSRIDNVVQNIASVAAFELAQTRGYDNDFHRLLAQGDPDVLSVFQEDFADFLRKLIRGVELAFMQSKSVPPGIEQFVYDAFVENGVF